MQAEVQEHDKIGGCPTVGEEGESELENDEHKSPIKDFRHRRLSSLDSLLSSSLRSPEGATIRLDFETNRHGGIGSVSSMLGGQQLSPILRSSEFGLPNNGALCDRGISEVKPAIENKGEISERGDLFDSPDIHRLESNPGLNTLRQVDEDVHITSPASNDSFDSIRSTRDEEIQLVQQQIGASAQAFIQGLRGAAHRRKQNLTRSRDSLAAKEKERREEDLRIAAKKKLDAEQLIASKQDHPSLPTQQNTFRAKPLPKTTGASGAAGLSGVPKVLKRSTTIPCSPALGIRRKSSLVESKAKAALESQAISTTFRARPVPKAVASNIGAGISGLPKMQKRPSTVPFSPLLGSRRSSKAPIRRHSIQVGGPVTVSAGDSQSTPLGLAFVNDSTNCENREKNVQVAKVCNNKLPPKFREFRLNSTIRAQKRASFNKEQQERWEARQKEEQKQRKERIHKLERDLGELRWEL